MSALMRDPRPAAARPQPRARSRAELVERPEGWVLTLVVDAVTAERLRAGLGEPGAHRLEPADCAVSITPNLVPGTPFDLRSIEIVVG